MCLSCPPATHRPHPRPPPPRSTIPPGSFLTSSLPRARREYDGGHVIRVHWWWEVGGGMWRGGGVPPPPRLQQQGRPQLGSPPLHFVRHLPPYQGFYSRFNPQPPSPLPSFFRGGSASFRNRKSQCQICSFLPTSTGLFKKFFRGATPQAEPLFHFFPRETNPVGSCS